NVGFFCSLLAPSDAILFQEGVSVKLRLPQPVHLSMTEEVYLDEMVGRINANMILPYPPGVPLVMPGEMITEESRPVLEFLQMLCEIGAHYPGFETDIHGAYRQADGRYTVKVLKEESKK
ncbi:Orn/Lys/Arg family decarboxylase, partial [Shigella sonnei]|uniref:Orn/Lys/Arg family decarboxylase n=1 Tax=Shigella sonnei TaxID=624 RepID=UPI00405464AF